MKLLDIIADAGHLDTLTGIAEHFGVLDHWHTGIGADNRCSFRMLVDDEIRQTVMDAVQGALTASQNARIVVLPVEAVLPRPVEDAPDTNGRKGEKKGEKNGDQGAGQGTEKATVKKKSTSTSTREELYAQIEKGARLDTNFMILTVLSTVVAAIGLLENNVAVVIGAMVIAPLLGPNIALAFSTTLGDRDLMREALLTNLAGIVMALLLSMLIGWLWPASDYSSEILSRTQVGYGDVLLALASGAAAVLSLTSGVSSALVGVMVAVALLPPTATLGMLLAMGSLELAAGAALLLAVNVVCVNLSANLVFVFKGVRPRTWLEKRTARQSAGWTVLFWVVALVLVLVFLYLRGIVR